jgi:LPXTG-motif cell wall-anchored protein
MLLGAVLSMTLVAAAPALAQVAEQEFSERRITSGKASPSFSVSNKGDNANLCPTGQQAVQTGNVANEQGVVQYASKSDDLDFTGSEIGLTPSTSAECTQTIEQAAAAGPKAEAKAGSAEAKGDPEAKAGSAEAKAGGGGGGGQLPKTGGITGMASLLGLGAGALLVSGGLLVRRIFR